MEQPPAALVIDDIADLAAASPGWGPPARACAGVCSRRLASHLRTHHTRVVLEWSLSWGCPAPGPSNTSQPPLLAPALRHHAGCRTSEQGTRPQPRPSPTLSTAWRRSGGAWGVGGWVGGRGSVRGSGAQRLRSRGRGLQGLTLTPAWGFYRQGCLRNHHGLTAVHVPGGGWAPLRRRAKGVQVQLLVSDCSHEAQPSHLVQRWFPLTVLLTGAAPGGMAGGEETAGEEQSWRASTASGCQSLTSQGSGRRPLPSCTRRHPAGRPQPAARGQRRPAAAAAAAAAEVPLQHHQQLRGRPVPGRLRLRRLRPEGALWRSSAAPGGALAVTARTGPLA